LRSRDPILDDVVAPLTDIINEESDKSSSEVESIDEMSEQEEMESSSVNESGPYYES